MLSHRRFYQARTWQIDMTEAVEAHVRDIQVNSSCQGLHAHAYSFSGVKSLDKNHDENSVTLTSTVINPQYRTPPPENTLANKTLLVIHLTLSQLYQIILLFHSHSCTC